MQYPGDDMDDLFRQAAENYPLNTNNADWSKVQAMLDPEGVTSVKRNDKRQLLWLLLLLPFFFICNRVVTPVDSKLTGHAAPASKESADQQDQSAQHASARNTQTEQTAPQVDQTAENEGDKHTITSTKTAAVQGTDLITGNLSGVSSPDRTSSSTNRNVVLPRIRQGQLANDQPRSSSLPFTSIYHKSKNNRPAQDQKGKSTDAVAISGNTDPNADVTTPLGNVSTSTTKLNTSDNVSDAIVKNSDRAEQAKQEAIPQDSALAVTPKPEEVNIDKVDAKKQVITTQRRKRFYAGLIGAPDVSTIKFEKFSQVGFEAGIILGFELSKKFAIEAGVFSDKKYYAGDGDYINTSKLYMPANAKLVGVSGNCRMIEIPVVMKYNISAKSDHSWFASAGISSYLMSREDYNYDYYYYNSGTTYTHNKVYTNETKNWVSVLQVSAGYTHRLGRIGDLRIEPYYKLPLKGLGYGELPISSMGIHFGITKKLF